MKDMTALERYLAVISYALFPTLVVLNLVNVRRGLFDPASVFSLQLIGCAALALLTLPAWWLHWRKLTTTGRVVLATCGVIVFYALVSSMLTALPHLQKVIVARRYLVAPAATAVAVLLSAWGLALSVPSRRRRSWLWWGSWTILACSLVSWPRLANHQNSWRMATGMGGASTVHVVMLLCAAVMAGSALSGYRPRWSWGGSGLSLALLVATGSRAGLASLGLAAGLLVLWAAGRGRARRAWALLALGATMVALALAAVPSLRRVLSMHDDLRQMNLQTALRAFTGSWQDALLGVGSGRLWPWLAYELGRLQIGERRVVATEFGKTLTNPHSTYLGIMVELGVVMLLVFLVACLTLVRRLAGEWRGDDPYTLLLAVAVVSSLAAFTLDYYLFKSFGVSWWWWLVVASVLGISPDGSPANREGR